MVRTRIGVPFDLGSIDPGNAGQKRGCYVAYWRDSGLHSLQFVSHADYATGVSGSACKACALETPIYYPNEKDPVPPNVTIALNVAGCLLAGALSAGNVKTYEPKAWKGNRAKPPQHLDVWEALNPRERLILGGHYNPRKGDPADVLTYINRGIDLNAPRFYKKPLTQYSADITNFLDSIGIGLKHLGRM